MFVVIYNLIKCSDETIFELKRVIYQCKTKYNLGKNESVVKKRVCVLLPLIFIKYDKKSIPGLSLTRILFHQNI